MQRAQQIYSSDVLALPKSEQLRLATLILEGLTESSASVLDYSDEWSEEDISDVARYSANYAAQSLGEE